MPKRLEEHGSLRRLARFVVVLDTMWGTRGRAPRWFPINPDNHSGRRLYRLTNSDFPHVWVTNACPQSVDHPTKKGTPSPLWLRDNLEGLPRNVKKMPLLVCGNRARAAFYASGYTHRGPVLFMKHPAARSWTKRELMKEQAAIAAWSRFSKSLTK